MTRTNWQGMSDEVFDSDDVDYLLVFLRSLFS